MLLAAYPTPHDLQTSALSDQNSVPFYLYSSTEWVVVQGHSLLGFQQQGRLGMCVWDSFHDFSFPIGHILFPIPNQNMISALGWICVTEKGEMVKDHVEEHFLKASSSLR